MSGIDKIIKDLENYKTNTQTKIYNLEREVELLSTELKMYKLEKEFIKDQAKEQGVNTLHILIHKERFYTGIDNETCLGVFTKHSTLLFYLTKILKQQQNFTMQDFKDLTISLKSPLKKEEHLDNLNNVFLLLEEIEDRDEYHTSILGIEVNTVRYFIDYVIEEQVDIYKQKVMLDKFIDEL